MYESDFLASPDVLMPTETSLKAEDTKSVIVLMSLKSFTVLKTCIVDVNHDLQALQSKSQSLLKFSNLEVSRRPQFDSLEINQSPRVSQI